MGRCALRQPSVVEVVWRERLECNAETVTGIRHLASKWLREAEKLAGLDTQKGSLWHAYRRKWVTERKYLPDVDVAAAGGWKDTQALKSAYQQADTETMLRVVLEAGELRVPERAHQRAHSFRRMKTARARNGLVTGTTQHCPRSSVG